MYFVLILLLEKVHKVQVQILSSELCPQLTPIETNICTFTIGNNIEIIRNQIIYSTFLSMFENFYCDRSFYIDILALKKEIDFKSLRRIFAGVKYLF
jgi:hypothetical protein